MKKNMEKMPDTEKPSGDTFECYLKLPDEIYLKKYDNPLKQGERKVEKIDITENGIYQHLEGEIYPFKGYPHPLHVRAVGAIKKSVLGAIRFLSKYPYLIPVVWFFRKLLLEEFADFSNRVLRDYYLLMEYYLPSTQEIFYKLQSSLLNSRLSIETVSDLCRSAAMFWEYEDTYRFRGQVFFYLLDKENLRQNPRKELKRVCEIMAGGELIPDMKEKWMAVRKLLSFVPIGLLSDFMLKLDKEKFRMDESDLYFAREKKDFDYDKIIP